jgi:glycosyltransferase involved in cell wall biosynthesis
MRVLALEPYYGGSHRAFLDGWSAASGHEWTLLTLPAHHWKWRMRHAAVTFGRQSAELLDAGQRWDLVVATDMLDVASFRGLADGTIASLPTVTCFHESQLTYPSRRADPRDVHFALTNMTSALGSDAVWFNSAFHRDAFLVGLEELLSNMPDSHCRDAPRTIRASSAVRHPGIPTDCFQSADTDRRDGAIRIVWAARWEHDKGPEELFEAMRHLRREGVAFRLAVIGEQFRGRPTAFERGREEFADAIEVWGHRPTREEYLATLRWADAFVSTAGHEFFGIAAVEAVACGALAVLPRRLAYPEVFAGAESPDGRSAGLFYGQSARELADALAGLVGRDDWRAGQVRTARTEWARRYAWDALAGEYDAELERIAAGEFPL